MSMRLNHPNDELGGMLLMCLPQEVVHELDAWSPMMPSPMWASSSGVYHWHPPVMDHARVTGGESPGRHGNSGSFYDPDLYTFYPGVSRRSASEAPGSVFRSSRQAGSKHLSPGSLAVMNPKLRPMTRQTSYKGKVMRGGIAKRSNSGMYRSGKSDAEGGAKHDKTFNYIDMLRSLGQAESPPATPPRSYLTPPTTAQPTSLLRSASPSVESVSEQGASSDDERSDQFIDGEQQQQGAVLVPGRRPFELSPPPLSNAFLGLDTSSPFRNHKPPPLPIPHRPRREASSSSITGSAGGPSMSPFSYTSAPSASARTPPRPSPPGSTSPMGGGGEWPGPSGDQPETDAEREEREMVMRFIADRSIEIVVLVEGNDATTGGVVQARHSYIGDEILWNTSFVPCVLQDENTGGAVIDYSLFHHTERTLAAAAVKTAGDSCPAELLQEQRRGPFSSLFGSRGATAGPSSSGSGGSSGIAIPGGSGGGYKHNYQSVESSSGSWYRASPPRHTYGSTEPLTPEERYKMSLV
jgi:hypothetical protein